jgi:hypothetical protein
MEGGISSIVSFYSVYNEMLASHPDLLERLHQPYLFDRQREHAPGDPRLISHPLFQTREGRTLCRLSHRHVVTGYAMAGQEMDELTRTALFTPLVPRVLLRGRPDPDRGQHPAWPSADRVHRLPGRRPQTPSGAAVAAQPWPQVL